jgi:hypothetical protein
VQNKQQFMELMAQKRMQDGVGDQVAALVKVCQ